MSSEKPLPSFHEKVNTKLNFLCVSGFIKLKQTPIQCNQIFVFCLFNKYVWRECTVRNKRRDGILSLASGWLTRCMVSIVSDYCIENCLYCKAKFATPLILTIVTCTTDGWHWINGKCIHVLQYSNVVLQVLSSWTHSRLIPCFPTKM